MVQFRVLNKFRLRNVGSPRRHFLKNQGELAHTTNYAGRTWRVVSMPRQANAICFVDPLHGWAAGQLVSRTPLTVRYLDSGQRLGHYLRFILPRCHRRGWACEKRSIRQLLHHGRRPPLGLRSRGGSTMEARSGLAISSRGWSVNLEGQIFNSSTDGGHTWALQATVNGTNLQTIQFLDAARGMGIGGDAFYHTVNGGQTWTRASVPAGTWAHSARFFDRLHAVAVGEFGNIVRQ